MWSEYIACTIPGALPPGPLQAIRAPGIMSARWRVIPPTTWPASTPAYGELECPESSAGYVVIDCGSNNSSITDIGTSTRLPNFICRIVPSFTLLQANERPMDKSFAVRSTVTALGASIGLVIDTISIRLPNISFRLVLCYCGINSIKKVRHLWCDNVPLKRGVRE